MPVLPSATFPRSSVSRLQFALPFFGCSVFRAALHCRSVFFPRRSPFSPGRRSLRADELLNKIDDDNSGVLELDELTEMVQVYADMKRAAAEGSIPICTLPKEIQPSLQVFDQDDDGTVAPLELARAAELYKESKDSVKRLSKAVVALVVVLVILVTLILIGTAQVIESSKETVTSAAGVTTVAGTDQPAASGTVVQENSLGDALAWTPAQLNGVKDIYVPEDPTITCAANTFCEDGTELAYTITGWARNAEKGLAFYSARGDTILVTSSAVTITDASGSTLLSRAATPSGRRRMQWGFGGLRTYGAFTIVVPSF